MTSRDPKPTIIVDTCGMFCPAPIIKLADSIRNVDPGGVVELLSDDPAIEFDLPAWCRSTGHKIVSESRNDRRFVYRVRKKR